ncbi:hypothetical protein C8R44DRAFT_211944 [Mycena epipterygia]|nr:hypothetical protein C8R44DRAFT_211944 [Mycena epipterygia]
MPATLSKFAISPGQSQRQCNYAITCCGIIIVLQTLVPGRLYIITGDGQRRCIEIKIDASNVGPSLQTKDVKATVQTLTVDSLLAPAPNEQVEVTVEEIEVDDLEEDATDSAASSFRTESLSETDVSAADVVDGARTVAVSSDVPQRSDIPASSQVGDRISATAAFAHSESPLRSTGSVIPPATSSPDRKPGVNKAPVVTAGPRSPNKLRSSDAVVLEDARGTLRKSSTPVASNPSPQGLDRKTATFTHAQAPLLSADSFKPLRSAPTPTPVAEASGSRPPRVRSPVSADNIVQDTKSKRSMLPPPLVPKRSPKKRSASEMEPETPAEEDKEQLAGGGTRKRGRVDREEPPRRSTRARATKHADV